MSIDKWRDSEDRRVCHGTQAAGHTLLRPGHTEGCYSPLPCSQRARGTAICSMAQEAGRCCVASSRELSKTLHNLLTPTHNMTTCYHLQLSFAIAVIPAAACWSLEIDPIHGRSTGRVLSCK